MGTSHLHEGDADRMLRLIDEGHRDDSAAPMPWAVLEHLLQLVPCDLEVNYQALDYRRRQVKVMQGIESDGERFGPQTWDPDPPDEPFWALWWHSLCSWPQRTGDLTRVLADTDFWPTDRDWRADPLNEALPEMRHSLSVHFPAPPGEARRILFFRSGDPGFTERDRQVLTLLRPHLHEIHLQAERRRGGIPQLTPREWEVLAMAAAGLSFPEIARELFISVGTVRKHMEHVRSRLGVHSIAAAGAMALPHRPGAGY